MKVIFDFGGRWTYANDRCNKAKYWECYFQPLTHCLLEDIGSSRTIWNANAAADHNIKVIDLKFRQSSKLSNHFLPFQFLKILLLQ